MGFLIFFIILLPWKEIKNYYDKNVNSLYAEFKEILFSDNESTEYEGRLWAKRKGFLKFLIEKPDSQLLFVRNDKVYLYDFEEKKETEIFYSPYLPEFFLLNFENFYEFSARKNKKDTLIFSFKRKDTTLIYDKINLYMPSEGFKPYKIEIISSSLAIKYLIIFKKFIFNPLLKEEIFKKVQVLEKNKGKKNGRSNQKGSG